MRQQNIIIAPVLAYAGALFCAEAGAGPRPWDLLKDPHFKKACLAMPGPRHKERWLVHLEGPANDVEHVRVGGEDFLLLGSCKPRLCDLASIVVLYSEKRKAAYGRLGVSDRVSFLGGPSGEVRAALEKRAESGG